jgi:hypothetical protein
MFLHTLLVIPSVSEESSTWMLRFAQHDRLMSFRTLSFVIPNASEESTHGCFTALRFVQHDMLCHSEHSLLSFRAHARNPLMDASLRSA